jgi:DNA-binding CsgD family transcriptional regulator
VDAVTGGQDALGETSVVLEVAGVIGSGEGVSTDILEAAGRAYVRVLSNAVRRRDLAAEAGVEREVWGRGTGVRLCGGLPRPVRGRLPFPSRCVIHGRVQEGHGTAVAQVVGRESELAALREFLDGPPPVPALVLTGAAGIGKTTLWEAGVAIARERGWNVLLSRASEAEVELSFAGLADLLDGVAGELIAELLAPQRRALEVALARVEPSGAPPEPLAIAAGLLSLLRMEAMGERVLVAVDDAQWLDQASAAALAFAARRVLGERVRLLLTVRSGQSSLAEREVPSRRIDIGAMTVLEARRLVSQELGLSVPRRVLGRLVETAHGNPLVVLELGRLLVERGALELGGELPVPELADELFGARVRALPAEVGGALLAAALGAHLTRGELEAIVEPAAIEEAITRGVLTVEGDRVRATHPLLAGAVREEASADQRQEMHLRLSGVLGEGPRSARHLALATGEPDAERAATLAAAAAAARRRGAARDAVDLAEHALRLTPPDDLNRVDRLLTLAEYLLSAGELQRLQALLGPGFQDLPHGAARARAHMLLAACASPSEHVAHLEQALAESGDQPALRSAALAETAMVFAVVLVERILDAGQWAEEGLETAPAAGPSSERRVLHSLAWTRVLRGLPIADLEDRFPAVPDGASLYEVSLERVAGVRHAFRGELDQARAAFDRLLAMGDERGETISGEVMYLHLCELALRAGDCRAATQILEEWEELTAIDELVRPMARCYAVLAAVVGDPDRAVELAEATVSQADASGWDRLEAVRALGLAALCGRAPDQAVQHLSAVWEHTQRERVDDPGAFPVAPDLVEALAELGRRGEAVTVTARLRELAEAQTHPWGIASADRCEAIVALASSYREESAAILARSAEAYGELGLGFDRARTLFGLGTSQRRYKKWGAARASLELAASAFDALGCTGWADQARSELERVAARRPAGEGRLTNAEARVVALAAEGLSNKEIASRLVVTVHTVEVHLSHAYAKLGVRSRAQLAQALAALQ